MTSFSTRKASCHELACHTCAEAMLIFLNHSRFSTCAAEESTKDNLYWTEGKNRKNSKARASFSQALCLYHDSPCV